MDYRKQAEKLRFRIVMLLFVRYWLACLTVIGFSLGILVLGERLILAANGQEMLWGLVSIVPAAAISAIFTLRRAPSVKSLYALLDGQNRCGGLLMAQSEIEVDDWAEHIKALKRPRVRYNWHRSSLLLLVAAAFLAAGFLLPQRYVTLNRTRKLDISGDAESISRKTEMLAEQEVIDKEQAEQYQSQLEQLKQNATAEDPTKTWESLDHIRKNLEDIAQKAAGETTELTTELTESQALAETLARSGTELDPELLSEAMKTLSGQLRKLASENQMLNKSIDPNVLTKLADGQVSAAELTKIAGKLKNCKAAGFCRMGKMCKCGLVDPNSLSRCKGLASCDSEGLSEFLAKNGKSMGCKAAVGAFCSCPGSGGINRGRADAPMTWKDPTNEAGMSFKSETLPSDSLAGLEESKIIAVSASAPQINNEDGGQPGNSGLKSSGKGVSAAVKHRILPQHKRVVQEYFEQRD